MALYHQSSVSIEQWIEVAPNPHLSIDVDTANLKAELTIGHRREFVMVLDKAGLEALSSLTGNAVRELNAVEG